MSVKRPLVIAIVALAFAGACSSVGNLPLPSGGEPTDHEFGDSPTEPAGPTPAHGSWSGTVTVHVVGHSHDEETEGIVYDRTGEVTDSYTLHGEDPPYVEFQTQDVPLAGGLENGGSQDEFNTGDSDNDNATGCKWHTREEWKIAGSWSRSTSADGKIDFSSDGTYVLRVSVSDLLEPAMLPRRYTIQHTIQSRAQFSQCPTTELIVQDTEEPAYWEWATYGISSDYAIGNYGSGQADRISGSGTPASPGLDGSVELTLYMPAGDAVGTVTVTWHLEHRTH